MPVFHGNYVRNHARVPAVSVCEWMDFRNKLVMESNQAFIDGECFVIDPILCVAEKLGDTLYDFCGVTPGAHFMLAIGARPYRIKMPGRSRLEAPRRFTYSSASYAGDVGLLSGGTFPSMREWLFNPSL